jgi:hypothetical protein
MAEAGRGCAYASAGCFRVPARTLKVEFFLSCWRGFVVTWMVWFAQHCSSREIHLSALSLSRQHFSQLFDFDLYSACKDGSGASEAFHGAQVRKRHPTFLQIALVALLRLAGASDEGCAWGQRQGNLGSAKPYVRWSARSRRMGSQFDGHARKSEMALENYEICFGASAAEQGLVPSGLPGRIAVPDVGFWMQTLGHYGLCCFCLQEYGGSAGVVGTSTFPVWWCFLRGCRGGTGSSAWVWYRRPRTSLHECNEHFAQVQRRLVFDSFIFCRSAPTTLTMTPSTCRALPTKRFLDRNGSASLVAL